MNKPAEPLRTLGGPVDEKTLREDLERYRQMALDLGASGAAIIPADWVNIDERVRLKCTVPRCNRAGESPNCPPYAPDLGLVRRAVARYSWAILFKCDVDIETHRPRHGKAEGEQPEVFNFHKSGNDLVAALETQAFRDGYHLAMGFGGGSCVDYLCAGRACQFLDTGHCRHPYKSRPSMEAAGMDVLNLTARAGWPVYAMQDEPGSVPTAITVGLVFVY